MCQIFPISITVVVLRFYSLANSNTIIPICIMKYYIGYFNYYGRGIVEVGSNQLCSSDCIEIGFVRPLLKIHSLAYTINSKMIDLFQWKLTKFNLKKYVL